MYSRLGACLAWAYLTAYGSLITARVDTACRARSKTRDLPGVALNSKNDIKLHYKIFEINIGRIIRYIELRRSLPYYNLIVKEINYRFKQIVLCQTEKPLHTIVMRPNIESYPTVCEKIFSYYISKDNFPICKSTQSQTTIKPFNKWGWELNKHFLKDIKIPKRHMR